MSSISFASLLSGLVAVLALTVVLLQFRLAAQARDQHKAQIDYLRQLRTQERELSSKISRLGRQGSARSGNTWSDIEGMGPHDGTDPATGLELLREIEHSINTPLSQIEVSLQRALTRALTAKDTELVDSLKSAKRNIDYSRAVLSSYRVLGQSLFDLDEGVETGLKDIHEMFNRKYDSQSILELGTVPAISRSELSILAIMLPIIQNSVEHGRRAGSIYCEFHKATSELLVIEVANYTSHNYNVIDINSEVIASRKTDETGGLGLRSVRRLVEKIGGNISLRQAGNIFTVKIVIPDQESETHD